MSPTYEYKCNACGYQFDEMQSITASNLKKCPKCGKMKLQRLISAGGGVIFKGPGFYATDYPKKPRKEPMFKTRKKRGDR